MKAASLLRYEWVGVCRNKAVRLVANRLYSEHSLQKVITEFATSKAKEVLPALKQPRPALQAPSANSGVHL